MKILKAVALGVVILAANGAHAQLTLTGTNYFQDFNSLNAGLPAGWSVRTGATATSLGTGAAFSGNAKSWGDATGEFGNCASAVSNSKTNFTGGESATLQSGCTNRALGIRQTGSFGDSGAAFVLNIAKTTGCFNFQLGLDFLMLSVQARSTTWTVDYAVGDNPVQFTPLGTFTDPGTFGATHANFSPGAALDDKGSNVWIRIAALSASTGSGTRDTFAVDNFSLSWTTNSPSANPFRVTGISLANGNVQIDFTGNPGDDASAFTLQCACDAAGAGADTAATITQTSPGNFRAVCAMNGQQQFYRIKRQ